MSGVVARVDRVDALQHGARGGSAAGCVGTLQLATAGNDTAEKELRGVFTHKHTHTEKFYSK
jgi:hypothetical protein